MKTLLTAVLLTVAIAGCGSKNKSPDTMPSNGSGMSGSDMNGSGSAGMGSGSAMMMNGSGGATGAADPCGG